MINIAELHPKFIIDEHGNKQSVVLSISVFQDLVEDLEDLAAVAERREELTTSHAEVLKELKSSGLL